MIKKNIKISLLKNLGILDFAPLADHGVCEYAVPVVPMVDRLVVPLVPVV